MNTYTNEPFTRGKGAGFLTGVFLGSLAGVITMLFLAPQSGKETRQQLQQKAMDLRDQAASTVGSTMSQIRTKAGQLKSDVEERAQSLKKQGQDVLINQLDRVSDAAESGKKVIQGKQ